MQAPVRLVPAHLGSNVLACVPAYTYTRAKAGLGIRDDVGTAGKPLLIEGPSKKKAIVDDDDEDTLSDASASTAELMSGSPRGIKPPQQNAKKTAAVSAAASTPSKGKPTSGVARALIATRGQSTPANDDDEDENEVEARQRMLEEEFGEVMWIAGHSVTVLDTETNDSIDQRLINGVPFAPALPKSALLQDAVAALEEGSSMATGVQPVTPGSLPASPGRGKEKKMKKSASVSSMGSAAGGGGSLAAALPQTPQNVAAGMTPAALIAAKDGADPRVVTATSGGSVACLCSNGLRHAGLVAGHDGDMITVEFRTSAPVLHGEWHPLHRNYFVVLTTTGIIEVHDVASCTAIRPLATLVQSTAVCRHVPEATKSSGPLDGQTAATSRAESPAGTPAVTPSMGATGPGRRSPPRTPDSVGRASKHSKQSGVTRKDGRVTVMSTTGSGVNAMPDHSSEQLEVPFVSFAISQATPSMVPMWLFVDAAGAVYVCRFPSSIAALCGQRWPPVLVVERLIDAPSSDQSAEAECEYPAPSTGAEFLSLVTMDADAMSLAILTGFCDGSVRVYYAKEKHLLRACLALQQRLEHSGVSAVQFGQEADMTLPPGALINLRSGTTAAGSIMGSKVATPAILPGDSANANHPMFVADNMPLPPVTFEDLEQGSRRSRSTTPVRTGPRPDGSVVSVNQQGQARHFDPKLIDRSAFMIRRASAVLRLAPGSEDESLGAFSMRVQQQQSFEKVTLANTEKDKATGKPETPKTEEAQLGRAALLVSLTPHSITALHDEEDMMAASVSSMGRSRSGRPPQSPSIPGSAKLKKQASVSSFSSAFPDRPTSSTQGLFSVLSPHVRSQLNARPDQRQFFLLAVPVWNSSVGGWAINDSVECLQQVPVLSTDRSTPPVPFLVPLPGTETAIIPNSASASDGDGARQVGPRGHPVLGANQVSFCEILEDDSQNPKTADKDGIDMAGVFVRLGSGLKMPGVRPAMRVNTMTLASLLRTALHADYLAPAATVAVPTDASQEEIDESNPQTIRPALLLEPSRIVPCEKMTGMLSATGACCEAAVQSAFDWTEPVVWVDAFAEAHNEAVDVQTALQLRATAQQRRRAMLMARLEKVKARNAILQARIEETAAAAMEAHVKRQGVDGIYRLNDQFSDIEQMLQEREETRDRLQKEVAEVQAAAQAGEPRPKPKRSDSPASVAKREHKKKLKALTALADVSDKAGGKSAKAAPRGSAQVPGPASPGVSTPTSGAAGGHHQHAQSYYQDPHLNSSPVPRPQPQYEHHHPSQGRGYSHATLSDMTTTPYTTGIRPGASASRPSTNSSPSTARSHHSSSPEPQASPGSYGGFRPPAAGAADTTQTPKQQKQPPLSAVVGPYAAVGSGQINKPRPAVRPSQERDQ